MQPLAVAEAGLDRMTKGMAEVQDRTQTRLALVLLHHLRLDLARAPNRVAQRRVVARQQRVDVDLQPIEESHVGDRPVFDDLGQAGAEFARRQRVERVEVGHHAQGLVEGADHVFAERVVDPGLAADRGVDLRQQCGRHLHKRHTAHVAGRGKASHVAHHAAAKCIDQRFAVGLCGQQRIEDEVQCGPVLVRLAVGQFQPQHLAVA